jgi:hypothetical protein
VEEERRRVPRFPFIATAEVIEKTPEATQAGISARVSEPSLYGCYVEMLNPLAKGAAIVLKIFAEGKYFETQGTAIYTEPNQGMGVRFQSVNPDYLTVLKQWLLQAAQAKFGKKE